MTAHKITVDVYTRYSDKPPKYRVFVDGDLLTERDAGWNGTEVFVTEHIHVNLEPGEHNISVEQVGETGSIRIDNITLDGNPISGQFQTS
jgi:hypothetical protein